MTEAADLVTAEQLARMSGQDKRLELVKGVLHEMAPAGWNHGRVAMRFASPLFQFVAERRLGEVAAAETGFFLERDPDTVRAPDVAYVSNERLKSLQDELGFLPLAPDLAVEVLSPDDRTGYVAAKVRGWLVAGSRAVVVVDPRRRTVVVHRTEGTQRLEEGDQLTLDDVLPGFRLAVGDLFSS